MRYKILFAVLLVSAVAAGLKFTSLTSRILSKNDNSSIVIEREDVNTNAVYLSPSDTASFDPFSVVNRENAMPISSWNKPCGKLYASDIAEEIFIHLCEYSYYTAFSRPAGDSFADSLMTDGEAYIYAEKFPYYNTRNELRYADIILTEINFEIVYLRFYDDKEIQLSGSEIEKAVGNMENYAKSFFSSITKYDAFLWIQGIFADYDITSREYEELWDSSYIASEIDDELFEDKESEKYQLRYRMDYVTDSIYSNGKYAIPDPYSQFFRHMSVPSLVSLRYNYKSDPDYPDEFNSDGDPMWQYVSGCYDLMYFLHYISSEEGFSLNVSEYSTLSGRIYQVIPVNSYGRLVIIYNPETQLAEGFFYDGASFYTSF